MHEILLGLFWLYYQLNFSFLNLLPTHLAGSDNLYCSTIPYLYHFGNLLTTQVFVNGWVYQLIVTSSLLQPHGILDWRLCDKHMANPNTAKNTGCVQVRDVKQPNDFA